LFSCGKFRSLHGKRVLSRGRAGVSSGLVRAARFAGRLEAHRVRPRCVGLSDHRLRDQVCPHHGVHRPPRGIALPHGWCPGGPLGPPVDDDRQRYRLRALHPGDRGPAFHGSSSGVAHLPPHGHQFSLRRVSVASVPGLHRTPGSQVPIRPGERDGAAGPGHGPGGGPRGGGSHVGRYRPQRDHGHRLRHLSLRRLHPPSRAYSTAGTYGGAAGQALRFPRGPGGLALHRRPQGPLGDALPLRPRQLRSRDGIRPLHPLGPEFFHHRGIGEPPFAGGRGVPGGGSS